MDYPPSPWPLDGQLWLSLFRARRPGDTRAHLYSAAFVSYEEPSPLTYSELLVARPVRRRIEITDIWVDSAASMAGGRELWAIPKGMASFARAGSGRRTTQWAAHLDGAPVASAHFADVSSHAPRTPFDAGIAQPGLDGGPARQARMKGTARSLPCLASWDFAADGPLAFLRGHRPIVSARMADFRMLFG